MAEKIENMKDMRELTAAELEHVAGGANSHEVVIFQRNDVVTHVNNQTDSSVSFSFATGSFPSGNTVINPSIFSRSPNQ